MYTRVVNAPQQEVPLGREYIPKIFEADATDDQRLLYSEVCEALAFDPETPAPIDSRYQITVSCRCGIDERREVKRLAEKMGLTRNTLVLTAIKLGMGAMSEAIEGALS